MENKNFIFEILYIVENTWCFRAFIFKKALDFHKNVVEL